jgi:lipoprotein-anchoring transpeptidase ErfK/SrfK
MNSQALSIQISIDEQLLRLKQNNKLLHSYPISSAKNGLGELSGSECTPAGRHVIRAKIGEGVNKGSVFVGRRLTGEIFSQVLLDEMPERDWILSRILWLSGTEIGKNRLGDVDTMRRYIYIHGAPDGAVNGEPLSHGCIRMNNEDVIALFDHVTVGTEVFIEKQIP